MQDQEGVGDRAGAVDLGGAIGNTDQGIIKAEAKCCRTASSTSNMSFLWVLGALQLVSSLYLKKGDPVWAQ